MLPEESLDIRLSTNFRAVSDRLNMILEMLESGGRDGAKIEAETIISDFKENLTQKLFQRKNLI